MHVREGYISHFARLLVCLSVMLWFWISLTINHWFRYKLTQNYDLRPFIVLLFLMSGWLMFLRKHEAVSSARVLALVGNASYCHIITWANFILVFALYAEYLTECWNRIITWCNWWVPLASLSMHTYTIHAWLGIASQIKYFIWSKKLFSGMYVAM